MIARVLKNEINHKLRQIQEEKNNQPEVLIRGDSERIQTEIARVLNFIASPKKNEEFWQLPTSNNSNTPTLKQLIISKFGENSLDSEEKGQNFHLCYHRLMKPKSILKRLLSLGNWQIDHIAEQKFEKNSERKKDFQFSAHQIQIAPKVKYMAFIDLILGLKILGEVENNTENYEREIIDLQHAKTRIQNAVSANQNEAKIAFIKVKVELLKRKLEPQAVEVFLLPWIQDNYTNFKANKLSFTASILYLETSILISFYQNKKILPHTSQYLSAIPTLAEHFLRKWIMYNFSRLWWASRSSYKIYHKLVQVFADTIRNHEPGNVAWIFLSLVMGKLFEENENKNIDVCVPLDTMNSYLEKQVVQISHEDQQQLLRLIHILVSLQTKFPKSEHANGFISDKIPIWEWFYEKKNNNNNIWYEYDSKSSKEIEKNYKSAEMDPRKVKVFTLKWQEAMPLVLAQEGYEIHLDLSNNNMVQKKFSVKLRQRDTKNF